MFGTNHSTSLEFIIHQTFLRRTLRPGNAQLHHVGETAEEVRDKHEMRHPAPFSRAGWRIVRGY
jgi:hypothetical protein